MTQTLASAILATARRLLDVIDGTATGGSATTLECDPFPSRAQAPPENDAFNGGTVHHLSGSRTGYSIVTDSAQTSTTKQTLTFASGTAVANGDRFAVYKAHYPLDILRTAVNQALRNMPSVPAVDSTLTTTAYQEAYSLPSGVYDVRDVTIDRYSTSPYYPVSVMHRLEELNGKLRFFIGNPWPYTGDTINIWYYTKPSELTTATSAISDYLAEEWLSLEAALVALEWRIINTGGQDATALWLHNQYSKAQPSVRAEHISKIPKLPMLTKLANY